MTTFQVPISSQCASVSRPATDQPVGGLRQLFSSILRWRPELNVASPSEEAIASLQARDRLTERY